MIATRFFLLGGHVVSPSSAAVGMLKLKVQPSNLPIVAPEKNPSVLEVTCRAASGGSAQYH